MALAGTEEKAFSLASTKHFKAGSFALRSALLFSIVASLLHLYGYYKSMANHSMPSDLANS